MQFPGWIAMILNAQSRGCFDLGGLGGELVSEMGNFAVWIKDGLTLLRLATSLEEVVVGLDLHSRSDREGWLFRSGGDRAMALLLPGYLDEPHATHLGQWWHLRGMNMLGLMLFALFLERQHCSPELLLVGFDLPLSLGSKCPVQPVPVIRRDGILGSIFLLLPAGNISLNELQPNFSVLPANLG